MDISPNGALQRIRTVIHSAFTEGWPAKLRTLAQGSNVIASQGTHILNVSVNDVSRIAINLRCQVRANIKIETQSALDTMLTLWEGMVNDSLDIVGDANVVALKITFQNVGRVSNTVRWSVRGWNK